MLEFFLTLANRLDRFTEWTGKLLAWLVLLLVLLVGYDVFMRYVFNSGSIRIQELEWHLFSIIFLLSAAYTLKHDDHVRLDIVYCSRFLKDRHRAMIDALGALLILLPFCVLILVSCWDFVAQAYTYNERSADPGGLNFRWFIKAAIPFGFGLLLIQGIAEFIKKLSLALEKK